MSLILSTLTEAFEICPHGLSCGLWSLGNAVPLKPQAQATSLIIVAVDVQLQACWQCCSLNSPAHMISQLLTGTALAPQSSFRYVITIDRWGERRPTRTPPNTRLKSAHYHSSRGRTHSGFNTTHKTQTIQEEAQWPVPQHGCFN